MSEAPGEPTAAETRTTASSSPGALLQAARQAQGLHIAALAASIKVPQRKLEALEGDRLDELPDVAFARALAKTVCRALKIDPQPVLELMPQLGSQGLEKVHQGLNTTYRDRPARAMPTDLGILKRPAIWLPLLIVLAAGFVFLMPQQWIVQTRPSADPVSPSASAPAEMASAVAQMPTAAVAESAAAPVAGMAAAPAASDVLASASAATEGLIEIKVNGESWVEVLDANGAVLLQRKLESGEFVGLDGTPPFRLKIGNAVVTRLSYRGQPVDLAPATRDNVARLELK